MFFVGVVLGYAGIEMAGFHAKETRNPRRDFPRAIVPRRRADRRRLDPGDAGDRLRRAAGEAEPGLGRAADIRLLLQAIGVGSWATKVMAALVGLGTLALISTWLLGPSKGLYAAERTGDLPPELHYVNKRHVPVAILVFQGILGTLFALLFLFVPSINTGYWMLTALTTQILVMMYIMIFAAAIRLRYTQPDAPRAYKIPGGNYGMWIVAGMGLVGSAFALVIGFVPPSGVRHWPTPIYVGAMLGAIVICSVPPFIIEKIKKPSWIEATPTKCCSTSMRVRPQAGSPTKPAALAGRSTNGSAGRQRQ